MTTAVATRPETGLAKKPATIKDLLRGVEIKEQLKQCLPRHLTAELFVRATLTAIMRTPKLGECDQPSFFRAMLDLAAMGLTPDGRRAHLIPFFNNKRQCYEVQLVVDYKGIAELVYRSGEASYIHADVVCENDEFEYDRGEVKKHRVDLKKPRGNVYAAYAICRFKDGSEKADVMGRDEVEAIRKRSKAGSNGPWITDWNEMAKKTVFRRLSKWLPLSPEIRQKIEADDDQFELGRERQPEHVIDGSRTDHLASMLSEVESRDGAENAELQQQSGEESQESTQAEFRKKIMADFACCTTVEQCEQFRKQTTESGELSADDLSVLAEEFQARCDMLKPQGEASEKKAAKK